MKVKPDQKKSFQSNIDALESLGFEFEGNGCGPKNAVGKKKNYEIFHKNGQFYRFVSMDHYNTTIYNIELKPINVDNIEWF